jgi:hypothetical protein
MSSHSKRNFSMAIERILIARAQSKPVPVKFTHTDRHGLVHVLPKNDICLAVGNFVRILGEDEDASWTAQLKSPVYFRDEYIMFTVVDGETTGDLAVHISLVAKEGLFLECSKEHWTKLRAHRAAGKTEAFRSFNLARFNLSRES